MTSAKQKGIVESRCEVCQEPFTHPKRRPRKTCSVACRDKLYAFTRELGRLRRITSEQQESST